MPLYDFRCPVCGHSFEELRSSQQDAPACPKCGHTPTDRALPLVNAPRPGKSSLTPLGGGCSPGRGFS